MLKKILYFTITLVFFANFLQASLGPKSSLFEQIKHPSLWPTVLMANKKTVGIGLGIAALLGTGAYYSRYNKMSPESLISLSQIKNDLHKGAFRPKAKGEGSSGGSTHYVWVVGKLIKGQRDINTILTSYTMNKSDLDRNTNTEQQMQTYQRWNDEIVATLTHQYKIHLMPKNQEDFKTIVVGLATALKNDDTFSKALAGLKIRKNLCWGFLAPSLESQLKDARGSVRPGIVLYTTDTSTTEGSSEQQVQATQFNKDSAQYCLNKVCELFGDMRGMNITPFGNKRVTSLIYYAQGDTDFKGKTKDGDFTQFYDKDQIHYKHNVFDSENENETIYHLNIPEDILEKAQDIEQIPAQKPGLLGWMWLKARGLIGL